MAQQSPIFSKNLQLRYAGHLQRSQAFNQCKLLSRELYPHDFTFYHDHVASRHQRNTQQLTRLIQALKQGKLQPQMLPFNVINSFYPSHVLHHHFSIFLPLLSKHMPQFAKNISLNGRWNTSASGSKGVLDSLGAFLHQTVRLDLQPQSKELPQLTQEGTIKMKDNAVYYSPQSSPYISLALLLVHKKGTTHLALIQVRQNGRLVSTKQLRDLGGTISMDYLSVGYNFNGTKSLLVVELQPKLIKRVMGSASLQQFHEFHYSLLDLQKSLWVTMKYTSMRRQFKTVPNSKQERPIITYQAVLIRIMNAFAQFMAFADLNSRLLEKEYYHLGYTALLTESHHLVLQHLVHLRECCGGFGYLQQSGHPGCMQRTAYRATVSNQKQLQLSEQFLKLSHYFTSSQQALQLYAQPVTEEHPDYMKYFGIFLSITYNMRQQRQSIPVQHYKREYLKQSTLMNLHLRQAMSKDGPQNAHSLLLQFAILQYILQQPQFINWNLVVIDRQTLLKAVETQRNVLVGQLGEQVGILMESIRWPYLRNVVVGGQSEQFYNQVAQVAKGDLRNSEQYINLVQQPIIELLGQTRSRL